MPILVDVPDGKTATVTGPARISVITDVPGSVTVDVLEVEPTMDAVIGKPKQD